MIEGQIKKAVRDVPDFPVKGIVFKDITPILKDHQLCEGILNELEGRLSGIAVDGVAGIESRGFFFGLMLAMRLKVPFIPVRKAGKLPYITKQKRYNLEYGTAAIEIHQDAFLPGARIIVHDDLLATGGTSAAAGELITEMGGVVDCFCFLIELEFLNGREKLNPSRLPVITLAKY